MLFSQQTFISYFFFSYTLLLVLQNNLNYVFTWKKITIFLFIDILGTKRQSAVWGQQVHLLLSQVRCPGTVPGSVSCRKWQLPVPSRLQWVWAQGHWDVTLDPAIPLWDQKSTPYLSLELTATALALVIWSEEQVYLTEAGLAIKYSPGSSQCLCTLLSSVLPFCHPHNSTCLLQPLPK